jgi:hypothetical protein
MLSLAGARPSLGTLTPLPLPYFEGHRSGSLDTPAAGKVGDSAGAILPHRIKHMVIGMVVRLPTKACRI